MNVERLAELVPILEDRLGLVTGTVTEYIIRTTGVTPNAAQLAELRDTLRWHISMAASAGITLALRKP